MLSKIQGLFTRGDSKPKINKQNLKDGKILTENAIIVMTVENSFSKRMYTYSINKNEIIKKFKISTGTIKSIALTPDKNKFYAGSEFGLYQFNMHQNSYYKMSRGWLQQSTVLTHDGRYLVHVIQISYNMSSLRIQFARNQKLLMSWEIESTLIALACTYDNKYVFVATKSRKLAILDIKMLQLLNIDWYTPNYYSYIMSDIISFYMLKNSQSAIVCTRDNSLYRIKWEENARTGDDFCIIEIYFQFGQSYANIMIFLSNDEKNLWLGSSKDVRVFNFETKKVIKTFKIIPDGLRDIGFFENDQIAILVEKNGDLTFIDLSSMKILGKIKDISEGLSITYAKIL